MVHAEINTSDLKVFGLFISPDVRLIAGKSLIDNLICGAFVHLLIVRFKAKRGAVTLRRRASAGVDRAYSVHN